VRAVFLALGTMLVLLGAAVTARADGLSAHEMQRLLAGDVVVRNQSLARGQQRYVGGVAYAIVNVPADDLAALLSDVGTWKRILPNTRRARPVGEVNGDTLIEMTQGNALVQGTYTMRVHRQDRELRFWMDHRRPHDIEDAWGFLRTDPLADGRTLVSYGVLVDLGPGLIRDLFEDKVRNLALSVPSRVRGFVVERSAH
jgi:hypothetical protein